MKHEWKIKNIEGDKVPASERALLSGKGDYVDFYEERQDGILRRDPATFEKLNREWQIEFLRKHGLKPGDRMLDYGCGPAAAGVYFIEYLEAGKWVGIDISGESIRVGQELVDRKGLRDKRPELLYTPGGKLDALAGREFDVILAQSVFTHLPPDEIIAILQRLRPFLAPGGRLFASFSCTKKGIVQQQLHNWYYDREFIDTAAREAGLQWKALEDWVHPYQHHMPSFAKSTLALFTLAGAR
jgi:ubiquinone/menaquinone biosynthesis C-methylase UbiE